MGDKMAINLSLLSSDSGAPSDDAKNTEQQYPAWNCTKVIANGDFLEL
jgi:hypothetical protein